MVIMPYAVHDVMYTDNGSLVNWLGFLVRSFRYCLAVHVPSWSDGDNALLSSRISLQLGSLHLLLDLTSLPQQQLTVSVLDN